MALASWKGHKQTVDVLLKAGATPDIQDQVTECVVILMLMLITCTLLMCTEGLTPLMLATQSGHVQVVKTLIDRKAKPNLTDKVEWCLLHVWIMYYCSLCVYRPLGGVHSSLLLNKEVLR